MFTAGMSPCRAQALVLFDVIADVVLISLITKHRAEYRDLTDQLNNGKPTPCEFQYLKRDGFDCPRPAALMHPVTDSAAPDRSVNICVPIVCPSRQRVSRPTAAFGVRPFP